MRTVLEAAAGNGAGLAVIIIGWFGASDRVTLSSQSKWAMLSVVGLLLAGGTNVVLLRAGRRSILGRRSGLQIVAAPRSTSDPSSDGSAAKSRQLVSGHQLSFFHRADCRLVRGKAVQATQRTAHERSGRRPCGVCQP